MTKTLLEFDLWNNHLEFLMCKLQPSKSTNLCGLLILKHLPVCCWKENKSKQVRSAQHKQRDKIYHFWFSRCLRLTLVKICTRNQISACVQLMCAANDGGKTRNIFNNFVHTLLCVTQNNNKCPLHFSCIISYWHPYYIIMQLKQRAQ